MTAHERALRALRTLAQFELAQSGVQVGEAIARSAFERKAMAASRQHCEAVSAELHNIMTRASVNPALLEAMVCVFWDERQTLQDCRVRLTSAEKSEELARSRLTGLRNRERSLERALQMELRKTQARRQATEIGLADDMWLHKLWWAEQ